MSITRFARTWAPLAALAAGTLMAATASAATGLTVVRDAATGQLRAPTAAESEALSRQPARLPGRAIPQRPAPAADASKPLLRQYRNGTTNARLTNDFISHVVLVRQADGSLTEHCVDTAAAAQAVLQAAAAAPAPAPTGWASE